MNWHGVKPGFWTYTATLFFGGFWLGYLANMLT